ncbi:hypothetical protein [Lentzea sp. NBRC 102530]|uniref:hypothetical protein n=1 Tax=Lentzea sp. NBRC 102530 TaxID=3032201 RepID=UPI0024A3B8CA|nr:hypothetical protein [Lentzea sp. NBRC 102530]GLY51295.1 hypothetical protein Lesp01_49510 [Lentzea sp. NBRC 102530]
MRHGVDLLDLYTGALSYRRVCALVTHLPPDSALWRALSPEGRWTRADVLAAATERRLTALWAAVVALLGHEPTDDQLASPLDVLDPPGPVQSSPAKGGEGESTAARPLREIAMMMTREA